MNQIVQWFNDAGHAALAAFMVSIVSVGVSVWALVISRRTQTRSLEEARERDRLHRQKKAHLVASIKADVLVRGTRQANQHKLLIENTGEAEAREIVVTLDGKPILQHPAIPRGLPEVRQVGPGSFFQYILALTMQVHPPFDVEIAWADDSGEPGRYRTTVTF